MAHHVVILGAGAMGSLFGGLVAEGGLDVMKADLISAGLAVDVRKGTVFRIAGFGGISADWDLWPECPRTCFRALALSIAGPVRGK